jgi:dinuclear metal center YbgI/SA1388 family protein
MKIKELSKYLEQVAPLANQESYDNAGLLVGSDQTEITKILVTLDCTEAVILEALENGCNLVIAHHPIIFGGIKKLNGKNYVERTIILAIQNNIAIYAIHTNLDNVLHGVNAKIAEKLGLNQTQILDKKPGTLQKLVTYVPQKEADLIKNALFEAGAGNIGNYSECSFSVLGEGSFMAKNGATPFVGEINQHHKEQELRVEVILPSHLSKNIISALKLAHPYEEVAYDLYNLVNENQEIGSGIIGVLPESMDQKTFLAYLKEKMDLEVIRYTNPNLNKINRIAICGGAGSFLLKKAIQHDADVFVTSDFKYHEFFDGENHLMIADIGHYESENFTKSLISEMITEKFPTFAILLSKIDTNPVNYYY